MSITEAIYKISKEAKKLRDQNSQLWEDIKKEEGSLFYTKMNHIGVFHKTWEMDKEIISKDKNFNRRKKYSKNKIKKQEEKIRTIKNTHRENERKICEYYNLKSKAVTKLIENKQAEIVGKHKFARREYALISTESFSFHIPINPLCKFYFELSKSKNLGTLNSITADCKKDINLSLDDSINILNKFVKNYNILN